MHNNRNQSTRHVFAFGPFKLFAAKRLLKKDDTPLPIGNRALDILSTLLERAGEGVTHEKTHCAGSARRNCGRSKPARRVQIVAIGKALSDGRNGARYIASVAGRGYSFVAAVRHLRQIHIYTMVQGVSYNG
jgi:DNA-binding winged helix-turn-helix (wHTH) protein